MTILSKEPDAKRGLAYLPGKLPTTDVPDAIDVVAVATHSLTKLALLSTPAGAAFLTEDAIWRDLLALTSAFRTIYSADAILAAWRDLAGMKPSGWTLCDGTATVVRYGPGSAAVECRFQFETNEPMPSTCSGYLKVVHVGDGEWRLWCLQTILQDFKEAPMRDLRETFPPLDPDAKIEELGADVGQLTLLTTKAAGGHTLGQEDAPPLSPVAPPVRVDVAIIGGGQAGLSTAGWLKALNISYVVLERNAEVGDNWTSRYESVKIHTPIRWNHLPFGPTFVRQEGQSEWLSTQEMKDGYQRYVKRFGINVWTSSEVIACAFDEDNAEWTITVSRPEGKSTLIARHLVTANGAAGTVPIIPEYPHRVKFGGVAMHSVDWRSAAPWAGKKGLIIGSANTAQDVAEDMLNHNFSSVMMMQRSKTYVETRENFLIYSKYIWESRNQELGDEYILSPPTAVSRLAGMAAASQADDLGYGNRQLYQGLEAVGFQVDRTIEIQDILINRHGGHFFDHGFSSKIIDGSVKVMSGAQPTAWTETGLRFDDNTAIDADVVVLATGFQKSTTTSIDKLVGDQIAERIESFWGADDEGEIRGAFKPCGFPHIWQTGGGMAYARYYTRFVALQIKADLLGKPLVPYLVPGRS